MSLEITTVRTVEIVRDPAIWPKDPGLTYAWTEEVEVLPGEWLKAVDELIQDSRIGNVSCPMLGCRHHVGYVQEGGVPTGWHQTVLVKIDEGPVRAVCADRVHRLSFADSRVFRKTA